MQPINFYQTSSILRDKAICMLVEKCYNSNFKMVIIVPTEAMQESLNKILWTYSQKKFIPHGSALDPEPHKQPIYISHKLENPNKATVLLLINSAPTLLDKKMLKGFEKILVIYEAEAQEMVEEINSIITDLKTSGASVSNYCQNAKGAWEEKLDSHM